MYYTTIWIDVVTGFYYDTEKCLEVKLRPGTHQFSGPDPSLGPNTPTRNHRSRYFTLIIIILDGKSWKDPLSIYVHLKKFIVDYTLLSSTVNNSGSIDGSW